MVTYSVFKPGKSAVMHKRGLKRDVAYRRRAKLISIGRIAADLFESEVFVGSGAVKNHIAEFRIADFRGDLRDPKNMLFEVTKHFVRLPRDGMTNHATGLTEEK